MLAEEGAFEPSDDIEFGREGKPFFVCGPYYNPGRVIAMLRSAVSEGNLDYAIGGPMSIGEIPGLDMPVVHL